MKIVNKQSLLLRNKKAQFDYEAIEKVEAGIVLSGAEAKAVRAKKVDFTGSYARPIGGEMFLVNLHIGVTGEDSRRTRKLLLNKKEILSLETKMKAHKLTAVPLSLYTSGRLIKVELALVRGKRVHEKRAQIKKRDIERDIESEFKDL